MRIMEEVRGVEDKGRWNGGEGEGNHCTRQIIRKYARKHLGSLLAHRIGRQGTAQVLSATSVHFHYASGLDLLLEHATGLARSRAENPPTRHEVIAHKFRRGEMGRREHA